MSQNDNQQWKPLPKTAMNNFDLALFAPNSEEKWARMVFAVETTGRKFDDNTFCIKVFTGVSSDESKPIEAKLDVVTFGVFIRNLQAAIDANVPEGEDWKAPVIQLEGKRWVKDGGKNKPDGTFVKAQLYVGKDKQGRVWIAVTSGKRPNIKFIFHKKQLVNFVDSATMQPLTEAQISIMVAKAMASAFNNMAYTLLVNGFVDPAAQGSTESVSSGAGSRVGGQGGSSSKPASDFSDFDNDIPF